MNRAMLSEPSSQIQRAAALLRAGEVVAFPTETVYGLGADALNPAAVAKVFAAKSRPADHPLIVHLPLNADLALWAREVPPAAEKLALAFWPGPLTLILPRRKRVPDIVTGGQDTVGLRVPDHPLARQLLAAFAGGIAAPSANRFGRISPTTAEHVREELGDRVALILDGGPCAVGIESTIVDVSHRSPRILRPGTVTARDIEDVLGVPIGLGPGGADEEEAPRVSGSLPGHYAPHTPLALIGRSRLPEELHARVAQGLKLAVLGREAQRIVDGRIYWQRALTDSAGYAHDLYAHLRAMDALGVDLIVVETPPEEPAWLAVCDRLARAASGSGSGEDP
jgi:L-threonylcarbamoyladenylate synthase